MAVGGGDQPGQAVIALSAMILDKTTSRNETKKNNAASTTYCYLFEHMMFNGSERYGPKEFDRVLEAHGGASNAYTSNDVTAYHDDFATEALPVVDRPRSRTGCGRCASPRRGSRRSGRW